MNWLFGGLTIAGVFILSSIAAKLTEAVNHLAVIRAHLQNIHQQQECDSVYLRGGVETLDGLSSMVHEVQVIEMGGPDD